MYANGRGIDRNVQKSLHWLLLASESTNPDIAKRARQAATQVEAAILKLKNAI
jgi:TPR repeat protein